jgi:thioredoxin 1
MAADEDIERIKAQKKAEIQERVNDGEAAENGDGAPNEPIRVEGGEHLGAVTGSYDVVLVDFYADWCGPCKMLEPTVESIAAETDAAVAKVDVDANQQLAAQYQVQGVPTMLLFADGEPVERIVGVRDQSHLQGLVQQYS